MSQYRHRVNLSAAQFPLSVTFGGQSVIVGKQDQNFNREIDSNADADKDRGIPQIIYCHNVVPTEQGFHSISFLVKILAMTPGVTDFDSVFVLRDDSDNRVLFCPAAGKNYIYDASLALGWFSLPFAAGAVPFDVLVTVAFVRGTTYICYGKYHTYVYNPTTHVLDLVIFSGLIDANVHGICASQNYLIAWDGQAIAWSNPTNELDFVPDITTGAGGGNVADIRANIVVCVPINNGFIVWTKQNAVGASFSGNTTYPFIFKEVAGSGGISSIGQVSYDDNLGVQYAFTTQGFQTINKSEAKTQFPAVSDFLAGQLFEDYDASTGTFTTETIGRQLFVKVNVCGNRFVVISYGRSRGTYTHALMYDIALRRWGKFKIDHVDVFSYQIPNVHGAITYDLLVAQGITYDMLIDEQVTYDMLIAGNYEILNKPKEVIGFVLSTGEIRVPSFKVVQEDADGVVVLGKYQWVREKFLTIDGIEVENVNSATNFDIKLLPSFNGKDFAAAASPTGVIESSVLYRRYGCRTTAKNISVAIHGAFYLASMQLRFHEAGDY